MATLNPHFAKLPETYIFPLIWEKLSEMRSAHPHAEVLNLGVGDISLPLAPSIARSISDASIEMTKEARGYGSASGYLFLKEAVLEAEYGSYGFSTEEIFISDGTNTDAAGLHELFDPRSTVLVPDPTYPVYADANNLAGKEVLSVPCLEEHGFVPKPPKERADLVYLCTPCNPTGIAMTRSDLQEWIDWAKKHEVILLIDNVYACFSKAEDVPRSIYELPNADQVAIELRSFSKQAGFTGLRCSYYVVPKNLHLEGLNALCHRWKNAKSNGVAYPIQRGAAQSLTPIGQKELNSQIAIYKESAKLLRQALQERDEIFYGGMDSPYIWWKTPDGTSSWEMFEQLLNGSLIVSIPGIGFGPAGEGYVRLSSFISNKIAELASERIASVCAM